MPDGADRPYISFVSLSALPRWVAWQTEGRGSKGKATKVPYAPDGRKAKADDPATWGSREAAEIRAGKLPRPFGVGGVGLELGDHDGLAIGGIDLDSCRHPQTGALAPWTTEVLELFASYAEISPSGTGVKIYFRYDGAALRTIRSSMGTEHGKQFKQKAEGDHPPAIELYVSNRYFAVTDQALEGAPAELRLVPTETLTDLIEVIGPEFAGAGRKTSRPSRGSSSRQREKPSKASTDHSRSTVAFRIACKIRRGGGTFEDFVAALDTDADAKAWKEEKGDDRQLHRAWENAGEAINEDVLLTEHGVAVAFVERYRDRLRYCHSAGSWYEWTGTYWRRDEKHVGFSFARLIVAEANASTEFKTQAITGKASFAGGVEKFAQRDPALAVTAAAWDCDAYLLATPGGVVDLRTGRLRPAMPGDMMTRITAVAPAPSGTDCPTWRQFLFDATKGDMELVDYLQRWCGYCLTGDTKEHALTFGHGPGGNGKSVWLNTVARILGDYATVAAMDTFTSSHNDKHPTDLAMLRGARLVTATETEEGRAWAEARIKQMTGGDPITARFMRQDFFTFQPQFKLTIIGNHKPVLKNVDEAARRRFNIVPFIHRPEHPDRDLEQKLQAEWPAILRWMIEGCLAWQLQGLPRPRIVVEATAEYFEAQDAFGQWMRECCDLDPTPSTKPGELLASFINWCQRNGEPSPNRNKLRGMIERVPGLRYVRLHGFDYVRGIRLKPDDQGARGRMGEGQNP